MDIGNKIKNLRMKKGLTQEELAKKCGLSKNAIWNYENNKRSPSIEVLTEISKALNTDTESLISYNELEYYENLKGVNDLIEKHPEHKDIILDILNNVCGIILGETWLPSSLEKNNDTLLTYKYNLKLYKELFCELYSTSNDSFLVSNKLRKNKDVYRFYVRRDKKIKRINDILEKLFRNYLIRYKLVEDTPKENNVTVEDKINRASKADE